MLYSSSLKSQSFFLFVTVAIVMVSYTGTVTCGVRDTWIVVLESYFHCCLGGEKKEYKCVCFKAWRTWKCFELGKIKFHIKMFYV